MNKLWRGGPPWWIVLTMALLGVAHWAALPTWGGEFNPLLKIGDPAPAWENLPGVDGKTHSLKDLESYEVVVVAFTCNTCPYANDYEGRVNALAKKHAGADSKVTVVAINVNKVPGDLLPAMKERAEQQGYVYPYLFDESQQIAKAFGAARTPEFFVLDKTRKIVYMGALDDNTKEPEVKKHYVEDAIAATINGESISVTETPPVGCAIRYARERRR